MEKTRSEKIKSIKENGCISQKKKKYTGRKEIENDYKKEIGYLRIIISVGIFTIALLVRKVDNDFMTETRTKLKEILSYNMDITEFFGEKFETFNFNLEQFQEEKKSETEETAQEIETRLVPTLEE